MASESSNTVDIAVDINTPPETECPDNQQKRLFAGSYYRFYTGWTDTIDGYDVLNLERDGTNQKIGLHDAELIRSQSMRISKFAEEQDDNGGDFTMQQEQYKFPPEQDPVELVEPASTLPRPFGKWIKKLHERAQRRRTIGGEPLDIEPSSAWATTGTTPPQSHKNSTSLSSTGFVETIKSASFSLGSMSIAQGRLNTYGSRRSLRHVRSRLHQDTFVRRSDECTAPIRDSPIDRLVMQQSFQRRCILEEIISSEESYLADMKFLNNVYGTFLASIPTLSTLLRNSIIRNIVDIITLHEEILTELHSAVPHSEYSKKNRCSPQVTAAHHRWHSLDSVPEHKPQLVLGAVAEPRVAAAVAQAFASKVHRFFVYEEYGAKYEMMVEDVASCYKTWPQWEHYQKGLETLAASLASLDTQNLKDRKSLTIGDLLVKPMQRTCRYPLLFDQLLKETPVCDDPESHAEIEKTLLRLRETTAEINCATDNPELRAMLEKTWILQDRLVWPQQPSERHGTRTFGHVQLCGVLYVAWQTKSSAAGQYMIAILYRDCLLLATAERTEQVYIIQAKIVLDDVRVESVDNGRGLQCLGTPFAWKLVFDCGCLLHEMVLSACSSQEEQEWKRRLANRVRRAKSDFPDYTFLSEIFREIRSFGTVFGKPDTTARRNSIKRAMTVGAKTPPYQILIRNTAARRSSQVQAPVAVTRAQSLQAVNKLHIFSPARSERIRLECLVSDVWSKEVLPFPSMNSRKSEHLGRAGEKAHSVMRKLSAASFAASFSTKRHVSTCQRRTKPNSAGTLSSSLTVTPLSLSDGEGMTQNEESDVFTDAVQFLPSDETDLPAEAKYPAKSTSLTTLEALSSASVGTVVKHDDVSQSTSKNRLKALRNKSSWYLPLTRPAQPLRTSSLNTLKKKQKLNDNDARGPEKQTLSDEYKDENGNQLSLEFGSIASNTVQRYDVFEEDMQGGSNRTRLGRWLETETHRDVLRRFMR